MDGNKERLFVSNMAEVQYLLERGHKIVTVELKENWSYSVNELCIEMEGCDISLDRNLYLGHRSSVKLSSLKTAFDEIMNVIYNQEEAGFIGGGR